MVKFTNRQKYVVYAKNIFSFAVCFTGLVLLFNSCSTKKNTWTSRTWHNINGEFNVTFNGRESFKEGVKKAGEYTPQDFNELLPVFAFSYDEVPGQVTSEMDRVIAKSVKAVQKHSITVKPKQKKQSSKKDREFYNQREFCKIVDDAYLLEALANMYLHQYGQSIQLFDFIMLEYPKGSAVKTAKLWQTVVLMETEDMQRAEKLLAESAKDKELKKKEHALLNAAYANFYIHKKEYSEAALYLEQALKKERNKANKVRYHFLLAQLYELSKENTKAIEHLNAVVKLNPSYDLVFAAQMRKASNATSGQNLQQLFLKMLKDDKNSEYTDQIYYALAKVEKANGHDTEAINYLKESIKENKGNNRQQGYSYATLGDYEYAAKDYADAYTCYDSAAYFLGNRHKLYDSLQTKAAALKQLAENLYIIQREDSLQRIARMPSEEREQFITAQINTVLETEKQQQQDQQDQQYYRVQQERDRYSGASQQNQGSSWYFYNPNAVNYGSTQFNMRWGKRPLEDNWRRRNKAMAIDFVANAEEVEDNTPPEKQLSNKTREYYMQYLPLTPEAMAASEERMCNALYKAGEAYKKDVHENQLAISTLKRLLERCSNSKYTANVYYELYQLYTSENRIDSASYYKQLLIEAYPQEPLAQMLSNPNYLKEQEAKKAAMNAAYEEVFQLFNTGKYAEADAKAVQMAERYPNSILQPQLAMIRALCAGRGNNFVAYKQALTAITKDYANSDVAKNATELLAILEQKELEYASGIESAKKDDDTKVKPTYVKQDDSRHYVAMICTKKISTNELLFNLESYNADTYLDKNFVVVAKEISANYNIVYVESFANANESLSYLANIRQSPALHVSATDCSYVIISEENLALLLKSKDVAEYIAFFRQQYPQP